jgi:hypothetical protein
MSKRTDGSEQVDTAFDAFDRILHAATDQLELTLDRGERKTGVYRALDNLDEEGLMIHRAAVVRFRDNPLFDLSHIDALLETRIKQSPSRDPRRNGVL